MSKVKDFKEKRDNYSKQADDLGVILTDLKQKVVYALSTIQGNEMKIRKCNFFLQKKKKIAGDLYLKN